MASGSGLVDRLFGAMGGTIGALAAVELRLVFATLILGAVAALITACGAALRAGLDTSDRLRPVAVLAIVVAAAAGGTAALQVVDAPGTVVRAVQGVVGAAVVVGLVAGFTTLWVPGRSGAENRGAPDREPPLEFGFHSKLRRQ